MNTALKGGINPVNSDFKPILTTKSFEFLMGEKFPIWRNTFGDRIKCGKLRDGM